MVQIAGALPIYLFIYLPAGADHPLSGLRCLVTTMKQHTCTSIAGQIFSTRVGTTEGYWHRELFGAIYQKHQTKISAS